MCIPVHYPWLPGYIDVTQTILIILTTAGLFPDRSRIYYTLTLSAHQELPHSVLIAALQFYCVVMWLYHNLKSPIDRPLLHMI